MRSEPSGHASTVRSAAPRCSLRGMSSPFTIRDVAPDEAEALGRLMVDAYARLPGFPSPDERPRYYDMLARVASLNERPGTRVLVAVRGDGTLLGGVVCFADMAQYGSGGSATRETNATGIRLLAVDPAHRNAGVGKALTIFCIERAVERGHAQVILHTTHAMTVAWGMYERLGFRRSPDLDFLQEGLEVFGFRRRLSEAPANRSDFSAEE